MKAVLGDTVIAEAPKEDLISIEGNWYFPPSSVKSALIWAARWRGPSTGT